jgi:catechol 2,3-dioxygenase-like lactoylglutathione lyase family enzyme
MDRATPNLPARDLGATATFYADLGFEEVYRDDYWMILSRGQTVLEFFPDPDVDPARSGFSCCLRLDDAEAFLRVCRDAGLPETTSGWPRVHPLELQASGLRIGALVDADGSLLRVIQNPDDEG